jgi:hypothetical protein
LKEEDMAENKREYWIDQIEKCRNRGVSQQKYCRENKLKYSTFKYWTTRIQKEGKQETGLIKLPLQYDSGGNSNAFEIITRNNFRIRTKELFNKEALKDLIEIVERL